MKEKLKEILPGVASLEATLLCLGLTMLLVLFGTLAQVHMGTFQAQQEYFNSFIVYGEPFGVHMPVMPGGLFVGAFWLANLVAAFIIRFHINKKNTGILMSHAGLILLVAGQFLAQAMSNESQMPIEVGHTSNYSENARKFELAFTMVSNSAWDEIVRIPYAKFNHAGFIRTPLLPFAIKIKEFFANAELNMSNASTSLATQGVGTRVAVLSAPPVSSDDESNNVSAFVEILDGDRSLGTWLLSAGLGAPQSFFAAGKEFRLAIRPRRRYYPFQITLKEFHHDIYPGTDIPKNFSSLVHLSYPEKNEERDVLIYMNHPLRYEGKTFYQASFGKNDRLSVLQVVENPAWLAPYLACALVVVGLAIQFLSHLFVFVKKSS